MSYTPQSSDGLFNIEGTDQSIQRAWDRYAMPDHSEEQSDEGTVEANALDDESPPTASAAIRVYDSSPAFNSTTALADALANARARIDTGTETDEADDGKAAND